MARGFNNGYIGNQGDPGKGSLNSNYLQNQNTDVLAMDTFVDGFDTAQNISAKGLNGTYAPGSVYYATDTNQLSVIGPHGEKYNYLLF